MGIGSKIKENRKRKGLTQVELAEKANLSRSYVADIERDRYNPSVDTLQTIASALGIHPSALLDIPYVAEPGAYYELNQKDERDIAKDLERILANLESDRALSYYGEAAEFDDEAKEMLRIQLEQTMRMAKQLAKKKFTPKKYRNE